jgi:hypothetical protein
VAAARFIEGAKPPKDAKRLSCIGLMIGGFGVGELEPTYGRTINPQWPAAVPVMILILLPLSAA